jgi:hypothetical protein
MHKTSGCPTILEKRKEKPLNVLKSTDRPQHCDSGRPESPTLPLSPIDRSSRHKKIHKETSHLLDQTV